jgi:PAS domain S-box-containing protein
VDGVTAAADDARLRALLDALPDLMLRLRADGTYLDVAGDTTRLAHDREEVIGSTAWELLPPETATELMAGVARALASGCLERAFYSLEIVGGELREFEARIVPSAADEVVVVVRDVTDLRRTVQQLRESRRRVVQAAHEERNRIERNLHDGAQQRLIALSHHLHLVARHLGSDPALAGRLLRTGQDELAAALEEIRELVRGLHPSVLRRRGLRTALGALAARLPLPTELVVSDVRFAEELEAAAYYVVAEGLTNAAKHAAATSAAVAVTVGEGSIAVEVADDGRGGADPKGSGLRGLTDRVEAFGGALEVTSPPGGGTTLRARLPLHAPGSAPTS